MDVQFGIVLAATLSLFVTPTIRDDARTVAVDTCPSIVVQSTPRNIDMDRVRDAWFGWYNEYRASLGLPAYESDAVLEHTAGNWSYYAVKRGTIDHKRSPSAPYYDYPAIEAWFDNLGVSFENVQGKTFTENIGWGPYRCAADDCTDELIAAIRTTFDFFLSEKDKQYRPHYNAIVSPYFTRMGLGIAIDPAAKRYFLTAHFTTKLASSPPSCVAAN